MIGPAAPPLHPGAETQIPSSSQIGPRLCLAHSVATKPSSAHNRRDSSAKAKGRSGTGYDADEESLSVSLPSSIPSNGCDEGGPVDISARENFC